MTHLRDRDVGLSMVENGQAWAHRAFLPPGCGSHSRGASSASTAIVGDSDHAAVSCPILAADQAKGDNPI